MNEAHHHTHPRQPPPTPTHHGQGADKSRQQEKVWIGKLLRKEVIQPHLPVRLPCYDLVPIASPTFDGSPPRMG